LTREGGDREVASFAFPGKILGKYEERVSAFLPPLRAAPGRYLLVLQEVETDDPVTGIADVVLAREAG
jgi:hypothetical protein